MYTQIKLNCTHNLQCFVQIYTNVIFTVISLMKYTFIFTKVYRKISIIFMELLIKLFLLNYT